MKNSSSLSFRFVLYSFIIAVVINSIVSTAQILYDKDFTISYLGEVYFLTLVISLITFAATSIVIYLLCLLIGTGRERSFWLLMVAGIGFTCLIYSFFKSRFHPYTDEINYIVAISGFSIMVSLASQYQLFHQETATTT